MSLVLLVFSPSFEASFKANLTKLNTVFLVEKQDELLCLGEVCYWDGVFQV